MPDLPPPIRTLDFQGCRLAWRIDGAGPPLLMIQGVGACGTAPNPQVEILKKQYACLSFDNRGIGASQPAGKRLTVEQMAADALALMDEAGWASAHIVGHSLGGLIALQIALQSKQRVRSLSLLCTFARGADGTGMTPRLLWIGLRVRFGTRQSRRQAFMELVLPERPPTGYPAEIAERLAVILGHDLADLPPIANQQLAAMGRHDVTARLGELAGIPTLVISAEKDLIARPSSGRAIAAGIPGARFIEIPGAAHSYPVLEPDACAALVLEHLAAAEDKLHQTPERVS